jgi:hypothetical protein
MLFPTRLHDPITRGHVTLAFRAWDRPRAREGARHRFGPHGVIEITSVERVRPSAISDADARAAGHDDAAQLLAGLRRRPNAAPEALLFAVRFRFLREEDPRLELGREAALSDADRESLDARLARMDATSASGPWTRATLALIAEHPHRRAGDLAVMLGRERLDFKKDVRRLKALGLTISHEVGYELSPRGHAYLAAAR